jgi:hypothetical protein
MCINYLAQGEGISLGQARVRMAKRPAEDRTRTLIWFLRGDLKWMTPLRRIPFGSRPASQRRTDSWPVRVLDFVDHLLFGLIRVCLVGNPCAYDRQNKRGGYARSVPDTSALQ